MHSHWRDCKAWSDEGLGMQTTNNQTAKLFDVNLTQYISMQDLPEYGGIGKSMSAMVESDPHFVLGRVFKAATCFSSNSASYDHTDSFRNEVDLTLQLATQLETQLSERENLHVEALRHMKDGWKIKACEVYERILLKHPNDLMAHKLNQFFLFFLGKNQRMKAGTELVFKGCPPTNPLHHFLHGDMAFTHCENGLYSEAEILGRKGILLYPKDSWSYHAIAHCLEMTGRYEEGSQWLDTTMQEWQAGNLIACHVHWHNAVMKLHTGDSEAAVNILCQKILKEYLKPKDSLSFVDSSSLLYRLKLEGVSVDEAALEEFGSILEERLHDHLLTFNDVHCMLALLASKPLLQAHLFLRQLQHYVSTTDKHDSYRQVTSRVGIPLCRALLSKEEGDLEGAVHSLQAIMDDIRDIGGSDAQRDVFKQALKHATTNVHSTEHSVLVS